MERGFGQWEDIRVLLAVARGGSFSAGARTLGTDQSTVSRRVAALEQTLGRRLFERTSRGLLLTRSGEALIAPAERVEAAVLELEDGVRRAESEPAGRVRVALTEGLAHHVVIPRVLPALLEAHPAIAIDLVTGDEPTDLVRQEADIALRFFRDRRGELVARKAAALRLAPIAARSAPWLAEARRNARARPERLPWIGYERAGAAPTPEAQWLETIGAPRPRIVCSSVESQLAAVRAGLGVALAPRVLGRIAPELVELPLRDAPPTPSLELFVVTRAAIRSVPRIAVVFERLVEALAIVDDR